jgi:hypothetical protein
VWCNEKNVGKGDEVGYAKKYVYIYEAIMVQVNYESEKLLSKGNGKQI